MRNLTDELESLGWRGGRDSFDDLLQEVFAVLFPSWTDEDMLFHPNDARRYCKAVRARSSNGLPDELILRLLVNGRKHRKESAS